MERRTDRSAVHTNEEQCQSKFLDHLWSCLPISKSGLYCPFQAQQNEDKGTSTLQAA